MRNRVVVGAGPIAAYLSARDQHNKRAFEIFLEIEKPVVTCEAAIMEAAFLVRKEHDGLQRILDLISQGVLEIDFSLRDEIGPVSYLIGKYKTIPMSLADACLVRMSEIFDAKVFTFDGDFRVYRRNIRQKIPLLGLED